MQVLARLVDNPDRLVTKDDLFSSVWDGTYVSESALTSVMKELRRALSDDSKHPRYIQSVYGRGYRLIEPVREWTGETSERAATAPSPPGSPQPRNERGDTYPPLLYVPAFDDAQLAKSHPWLGEIIREELLLALSRFRDIRLVSDTAANSAPSPLHPFGERDYQLGIRLLHDGSSIHLFAKISWLEMQEIIWADRQQLDPAKPAPDIEQFIEKVAAAALPRVHDDVTRHLPERTQDAYGIYLQNKLAMRGADTLAEMQALAAEWEKLVDAQPAFAQAYAPLVYLYNTDFGYTGLGTTGDKERARAYLLARKAVMLESSEPHLHTVCAWCHLWAGEVAPARQHLDQALELNPYQRDRLLEVATALMFIGELDLAAELLARCETLTPFATGAPHEEAGLLHLLLGQYAKAIDCLTQVAKPSISGDLYALLAAGAAKSEDFEQRAAQWVERVQRRWQGAGPPDADALLGWAIYHHPFQDEERRDWMKDILAPALSATLAPPHEIPVRARGKGSSRPSAAPPPS